MDPERPANFVRVGAKKDRYRLPTGESESTGRAPVTYQHERLLAPEDYFGKGYVSRGTRIGRERDDTWYFARSNPEVPSDGAAPI